MPNATGKSKKVCGVDVNGDTASWHNTRTSPAPSNEHLSLDGHGFEEAHETDSLIDITEPSTSKSHDACSRRQLRHQYRQLINNTRTQQDEKPADMTCDDLSKRLDAANMLFKQVTKTREAALDFHFMYLCASLSKQSIQALDTNFRQFQPFEYAEKIISFLSGHNVANTDDDSPITADGWAKLGHCTSAMFCRSPYLDFMLGSFPREAAVPLSKPHEKLSRNKSTDKEEKAVCPDDVAESQFETTTEEVERVNSLLLHYYRIHESQPLCYFEFVINPNSYGQTIENIFHVSFLVKDGHAEVFLDADKLPCIVPILNKNQDSNKSKSKKSQVVLSLTKAEWKQIVKTYKIHEPLIVPKSSKNKKSPTKRQKIA